MISGIFHIAKTIAITVVVCMILQTKIGDKTLEQNFYTWIQNSAAVEYLQTAIDGGVSITHTGYQQMHIVVSKALSRMSRHAKKSGRGFAFDLKRFKDKAADEDDAPETALPKAKIHAREIK